jgi:hypothetical protein
MSKEKQVIIGFGTTFKYKKDPEFPDRTDVVIKVNPKTNNFQSGMVSHTDEGPSFSAVGGADSGVIEQVGEKMTLEEVIEAAKRGAKQSGAELSDDQIKILKKYAKTPAIKVTLGK